MPTARRGQAADGEISHGRAATYEHRDGAAAEVATDLFNGIKEMALTNQKPSTVWTLSTGWAPESTCTATGGSGLARAYCSKEQLGQLQGILN